MSAINGLHLPRHFLTLPSIPRFTRLPSVFQRVSRTVPLRRVVKAFIEKNYNNNQTRALLRHRASKFASFAVKASHSPIFYIGVPNLIVTAFMRRDLEILRSDLQEMTNEMREFNDKMRRGRKEIRQQMDATDAMLKTVQGDVKRLKQNGVPYGMPVEEFGEGMRKGER
ncbi:MAG: hypothetical protein Q9183_003109 [Haloplaca sp. 2 TL-2023]